MGKDDYEKWAWDAWHPISGVFLLSPPNVFGYMEGTISQVAFATYLGQACPVMPPRRVILWQEMPSPRQVWGQPDGGGTTGPWSQCPVQQAPIHTPSNDEARQHFIRKRGCQLHPGQGWRPLHLSLCHTRIIAPGDEESTILHCPRPACPQLSNWQAKNL